MRKTQSAIVMLLLTLSCCLSTTGCAATVSTEGIDRLVSDLGSEKYRIREAADSALRNLLSRNMRSLRAAVPQVLMNLDATTAPEVATRLERILGPFAVSDGLWEAEFLYIEGLDLYRQGYLKEAVKELRTALRINPQHGRAKRLIYEAIWLITEHECPVSCSEISQEVAINAAKKELKNFYDSGRKLMKEEKYQSAKECFEHCVEIIRWCPYYLESDERYTDAIEECDRKLGCQSNGNKK